MNQMPGNFQPDIIKMSSSIIKVIGVGGGGSNAVNHMFKQGIEGVEFYVCNTDAQALAMSPVPNKIQLGIQLTEGLGAGSEPDMGRKAALESVDKISDLMRMNTKMVFITAGMGGGTGTGAAPVIAKIAKETGVLTVGIVTVPFEDEGPERIQQAQSGIENLKPHVDALLTISNDRIIDMYGDLAVSVAFSKADNILCTAAKGIAEIITVAGNQNVDFKDVETAMKDSGRAIMGTGIAAGENRAEEAVRTALDSPLLNNTRILGARHLLVNITYGAKEPTMKETKRITQFLQSEAGNNAKLKFGLTHDSKMGEELAVTVIATGFADSALGYPSAVDQAIPELPELTEELPVLLETHDPVDHTFQQLRDLDLESRRAKPVAHPSGQINANDPNVPAYLRRGIKLEEVVASDKNIVARHTITSSEEEKPDGNIRNNSFLHDNVD